MLANLLDSTNLKADAPAREMEMLCQEAVAYGMAAVCIHPYRVELAARLLSGTPVQVCTVVGFPLGANLPATKLYEARCALSQGADELDMVINLAALKDRNYRLLEREVRNLAGLKIDHRLVLKVIVETAVLTPQELADLTCWVSDWGADYIKTSTGFGARGVSWADIETIKAHKSSQLKIKASGGIRTPDLALKLQAAGVDRIGTSQAGAILREMEAGKIEDG